MRLPKLLGVIGVVGLSAVATALALRAGSDGDAATTSAHERALRQENDRLHKVIESQAADLARFNGNPNPFVGTGTAASSQNGMTPLAGATQHVASEAASAGSAPSHAAPPVTPATASPTDMPAESDSPTPEQSVFFEDMKQRLDDPAFVRTLNLSQFSKTPKMQTLPEPLKQELLAKVMQKYTSGEVDEKTFLSGMPGYPQ